MGLAEQGLKISDCSLKKYSQGFLQSAFLAVVQSISSLLRMQKSYVDWTGNVILL